MERQRYLAMAREDPDNAHVRLAMAIGEGREVRPSLLFLYEYNRRLSVTIQHRGRAKNNAFLYVHVEASPSLDAR
jgi:hypothetical protein